MLRVVIRILFSLPKFRGRNWLIRRVLSYMTFAPTFYGPLMQVNLSDYTNKACIMGNYGTRLYNIIKALPKDGILLDIGSNQGLYALIAAKHLERGRVYAFEPNSTVYAMLMNNIAQNQASSVTALNCGIGTETSLMRLAVGSCHSGAGRIINEQEAEAQWVILLSGSALKEVFGSDIQKHQVLCKIDTEGYEMKILQALAEINCLKHINSFFIEIDDKNLSEQGSSVEDIYNLMAQAGFTAECGPQTGQHYDEFFTR